MAARTRMVVAVVALAASAGLAGCADLHQTGVAIQQAQGAQAQVNDAQSCLNALSAANFMPNFADPQHAQRDARAKVAELGDLAARTTNATLRRDLLDVQRSVQQVADGSVTIETSDDWTAAQLDELKSVTTTCSDLAAG